MPGTDVQPKAFRYFLECSKIDDLLKHTPATVVESIRSTLVQLIPDFRVAAYPAAKNSARFYLSKIKENISLPKSLSQVSQGIKGTGFLLHRSHAANTPATTYSTSELRHLPTTNSRE